VDGQRVTARLELKPIDRADADQLRQLHQDPGIARWYAGAWTIGHASEFAAAMEDAWRADGVGKWLAYRREDGALIGRGGCSLATVEGRRQVEIGWAIREAYWGHGYATEIGRAGLAFAFETLRVDRVVAFTEVHNLRSRAVMERLGMTYSHAFHSPGLISGSEDIHDDALFALYEKTLGHACDLQSENCGC
jgi:RimJ/RimL family protein N-acetyltransferase